MSALLESRGLSVGRAGREVLSGVDLAIRRGERVALLGRNGAGKSTLLRALAAIDRPLAGHVLWAGAPPPSGTARVQHAGVLFQGEPPAPFTVRELVTLGLGLDRPPGPAARARVDQVLSAHGLGPLAGRTVSAISGGERQRVLLARARVAGALLLFLDEPTTHLDPAHQAELAAGLAGIDATFVLATHDLGLAATCDRIVLLADGRVVADGPPETTLTAASLARVLGVTARPVPDPAGGPDLWRIVGPAAAPRSMA